MVEPEGTKEGSRLGTKFTWYLLNMKAHNKTDPQVLKLPGTCGIWCYIIMSQSHLLDHILNHINHVQSAHRITAKCTLILSLRIYVVFQYIFPSRNVVIPVHTIPIFLKIHFNIILPHTPVFSKMCFPLSVWWFKPNPILCIQD